MVEELVQLLIGVVDAQLLKGVDLSMQREACIFVALHETIEVRMCVYKRQITYSGLKGQTGESHDDM